MDGYLMYGYSAELSSPSTCLSVCLVQGSVNFPVEKKLSENKKISFGLKVIFR